MHSGEGSTGSRAPAWTPEEERAVLERLLDYGAVPWAPRATRAPWSRRRVLLLFLGLPALTLLVLHLTADRALLWAASTGRAELVRCLLDAGADVNAGPPRARTPLQEAVARGHVDVVVVLLEEGADPNLRPENPWAPNGGRSCLSMALKQRYDEIAGLLRSHGATE